MAADSNSSGFHQGLVPSMLNNRHILSFQSSGTTTMNNTGMTSGNNSVEGEFGNNTTGIFLSGGPSNIITNNTSRIIQAAAGPSSSNTHFDSVSAVKQDTAGLSSEWTIEEQIILNQGLLRYASEHSIMKYIKIAAMLPRKAVRDVAVRCRLLAHETAKRRKFEEHYAGKNMKDRKEKMVDSCTKPNVCMLSLDNVSSYSSIMHQVNQNDQFSCQVIPVLDGATQQLMDENARILSQISANLETFQIQENIDLFYHTKDNITTILNNMSNMPGIMSEMPSLPVDINEGLLNSILPSQAFMFGVSGIRLEQQPRCDNQL